MDSAGSPPGQLHLYLEARAGRPVSSWRWRLGPARFGSYRKPMGVLGVLPYLPPVATTLPASEAVTAVTDYFSSSPLFFGRRVIDVQSPKRRPPTTALSKKLHPLPSSIRRIINLEPPSAPLRGARAKSSCGQHSQAKK